VRVSADGLSEAFSYVTDWSAAWYSATDAGPLRVSVPVSPSYDPVIPFWSVNASWSCEDEKLPVICTVAAANVVESGSLAVMPGSTATGPAFSA